MTDPQTKERTTLPGDRDGFEEALAQVRALLRGLSFGSVNIIVQDGVVIQIDRMEKRRLRSSRDNVK